MSKNTYWICVSIISSTLLIIYAMLQMYLGVNIPGIYTTPLGLGIIILIIITIVFLISMYIEQKKSN